MSNRIAHSAALSLSLAMLGACPSRNVDIDAGATADGGMTEGGGMIAEGGVIADGDVTTDGDAIADGDVIADGEMIAVGGAAADRGATADGGAVADGGATAEGSAIADGSVTAGGKEQPWIAFASNRAGSFDIYLVHTDGSDLHPIVEGPGEDLYPSWSPDGASLAFSSDRSGSMQLHTVDIATRTQDVVPIDGAEGVTPVWSPDGKSLAFGGDGGLFLVGAAGGSTTALTTGDFRDNSPAWAPDGHVIYFSSDRGGAFDVWSVKPDGTDLIQVTTGTDLIGGPAVSPDGRTLAYASGTGASTSVTLWSLATDTSLVLSDMGESQPQFSSAGDRVALTSVRYAVNNPELVTLAVSDATDLVRLTNEPAVDAQATYQPLQR